ncbi:amino acid adenylation domain-containing protein [Streptomyces pilosus]|uniref:amino acid adenylation domain-containing protein n=1 Tax=Streptomyces pilosus TaxID=28893 RepID=UPI003642204F
MSDDARTLRRPTSAAQLGIWVAQQLQPDSPLYNCGGYYEIHGPVDVDVFARAVRRGVEETEALRSHFVEDTDPEDGPGGEPRLWQVVTPAEPRPLRVVDLRDAPDPEAEAHRWTAGEMAEPFDLTRGPLSAQTLLLLADDRSFYVHRYHHAALDGFGQTVYAARVAALYDALLDGRQPPASPFATLDRVVADETASPGSRRRQGDRAYWLDLFTDVPDPISLADRVAGSTHSSLRRVRRLSPDLVTRLTAVAERLGVQWPALAVTATAALYHRMTGRTDFTFALPLAGRTGRTGLTTPGAMVNVLPIRVRPGPDRTFADLAAEISRSLADVIRHQRFRGEDLVRELGLSGGRQARLGPTVNVMAFAGELSFGTSPATVHPLSTGPVNDLKINFYGSAGAPGGVRVEFDADPGLYDDREIDAHQDRLVRVLEQLAADPGVRVGAVEVLAPGERERVLGEWNGVAREVRGVSLPVLFGEQAARTPDAVAVVAGERSLSYAELDAWSNRVARWLITRGVRAESFVGVMLPRSVELVVALLGVVKAGGAYVPIDVEYPAERVGQILGDARPVLMIDDPGMLAESDGFSEGPVTDEVRVDRLDLSHPAYVIFTSGSTGRPKGVVVEHRSVGAYLERAREVYGDAAGTALLHSSVAFDLTVTALYSPLVSGGRVVLAELDERAGAWGRPSFMKVTPSHLGLLQALPGEVSPSGTLVTGGEALVGEALETWRAAHPDVTVINAYGPTEATVNCTDFRITPGEAVGSGPVPIGRPFWNTRAYVLDERLRPVPPGVAGELYIGGVVLARGYFERPDLTAERFTADPYGPAGARMYRTGDMARWNADGQLVYAGRVDDQVKLRGFRIELGEIQAVIAGHPDVFRAAVVVREDRPGDQRLVAYIVGSVEGLREYVAARLPEYMVPSAFVALDALPLTTNGKLDRRALPAPDYILDTPVGRAPRTPREEILCGLFAEILGVDTVSIDDDFFRLGGHSLLATRLVSRVRTVLGTELPIRQMFDTPTVAGLGGFLDATSGAGVRRGVAPVVPRPERIPLSYAQQRLRFLQLLDDDSTAYNAPGALRLTGPLDREALRLALADVVARHESLRTVFGQDEEGFTQRVLAPGDAPVGLDVRETDEDGLPAELVAAARHRFDLAAEPPLRATLFALSADEHVLLLLLHHIAGDGWSMRPLARDLAAAYAARAAGGAPVWEPLPVQYADYSLWQREVLGSEDDPGSEISRQLAYWTGALAGLPEELALPADRERDADLSQRGGQVSFRVPAALHQELRALGGRTRASLFMVLQAALAGLLTRLGAGTDIPIGTPIAGRTDTAVEELVGFFANTLVLRTDTSGDPAFTELVERVRTRGLEAYAHQDLPFERLVEAVNPERSLARHPLFQVCLTLHSADPRATVAEVTRLPRLAVELERLPIEDTKFDLNFELTERFDESGLPAGIVAELEFNSGLFETGTARSIGERYLRLLAAVAAEPCLALSAVEVLDAAERAAVLDEWSGAARPEVADALTRAGLPAALRPTRVRVLDESLRPVPPGVPGMLFAAGDDPVPAGADGVDLGRLLPSPFPGASWLYRTDRAARWTADGGLRLAGSPDAVGEPVVLPARSRTPRSPLEQMLCTLFGEVLGVPSVGIDDGFFDRGGHSLSAVRLLSRVRSVLGAEISIRTFFENPTVAGLAEAFARASGARSPLLPVERPRHVPLSYAQQRLWFLHNLEGPSATYNIPVTLRLTGSLDRAALRQALTDVVVRHESLRTLFADDPAGARQVVVPAEHARPVLTEEEVPAGDLDARVRDAASYGFDLRTELPVRSWLFSTPAGDRVLTLVVHHIAGDGWSMGPLARDLSLAYAARARGEEPAWTALPVQYADYTLWQREVLGSEDDPDSEISRQLGYWARTLDGLPEELELPTDRPRPSHQSHRGGRVAFEVPAALHGALTDLARQSRSSLFMVLQSALAAFLTRLGAGTDVPIGTPIAGRTDTAVEELVGFFVNTLVLRTDTSGDPAFTDLVARVRETNLGAYAHQDLPFERLVEVLSPVRSLARHPLFQVLLGLDNNQEALDVLRLPGLTVDVRAPETGRAKFDLAFFFDETYGPDGEPTGMHGAVEYNADLFDPGTARDFADRLLRLLGSVAADPHCPVGRLDVMTPAELAALADRNRTGHEVPEQFVPELVERQVADFPDATAVVSEETTLSYGDLNARANRLARHLAARGVGGEDIVVVALPRSADMIVSLLAVLKTGAAYLTLDVKAPEQRLRAILDDCGPAAVLTDTAHRPLPGEPGGRDVVLDDPATVRLLAAAADTDLTDADRVRPLDARHPAYVVYTSGSTGTPKGVVMPMGSLTNLLAWHTGTYGGGVGTRTAQFCAVSFDFAVQEILQALVAGKTLVLPGEHVRRDAHELAAWTARHGVNELFAPTLVIDAVLAAAADRGESLDCLTDLFQGGEQFRLSGDLRAFCARGGRRMAHNIYGPAEVAAITSSTLPDNTDEWPVSAPIGAPIWNAAAHVLDERLRPVAPGVRGELYIGGAQMARGYQGRPDRTAERFVASPFGPPGTRLYRTGDVVRWNGGGELEFLGRSDHQVKIGGFRVEPAEVESVLAEHPDVDTAAVVTREDTPGAVRLVAYVVPERPGEDPDLGRVLRTHIAGRLPHYMVPAAVTVLPALPLTANGKLDRAALPAPEAATGTAAGQGPRTDREKTLCALFADVLGVREVGIDDGFFDLGGDSIMSIQLVGRARRAGLELSVRDIFEHRTVAALASVVTEATGVAAEEPGAGLGEVPLTPIKHWLLERSDDLDAFNMSAVLQVPAGLDPRHLTGAVQALLDHHDALRARLTPAPGRRLEIPAPGTVDAAAVVHRADAAGLDEQALIRLVRAEGEAARDRLDLAAGRVVQVVWADRGGDAPGLLVLVIHHLVVDGVSWRILIPDLAEAHEAVAAGRTPALQPVGTSLRRWAQRLTQEATGPAWAADAAWWQDVLRAPDPMLGRRALDPARDTHATSGRLETTLPADVTEAVLTRVPAAFQAEVNDVLLTAFGLAWARWRGTRGLLLDLEGHGREDHLVDGADLSRTIGWFTNLYPVRLDTGPADLADAFAGGPAAGAALKAVKEQLRTVPAKGMGYGFVRRLNPDTAAGFAALPEPQVAFNYLGRFSTAAGGPVADWTPLSGIDAVSGDPGHLPLAHPLELNARTEDGPGGSRLVAFWTWAEGILTGSEVRELADLWFQALNALVAHARDPHAGGLTPSDVSLSSITQDEIEAFEDELDDLFEDELDDLIGDDEFAAFDDVPAPEDEEEAEK